MKYKIYNKKLLAIVEALKKIETIPIGHYRKV